MVLIAVAILAGFAALAGVQVWARRPVAVPPPAPAPVPDQPPTRSGEQLVLWDAVRGLAVDVAALKVTVAALPGVYQEEADRANRAAEREDKAARRDAKRRAREDFESGQHELSEGNALGGFAESVPAMHQAVGGNPSQAALLSNARRAVAQLALMD